MNCRGPPDLTNYNPRSISSFIILLKKQVWNFLQAKEDLMKSIQTFLKKFNRISFGEMPKVLLLAWEKFFEIQHAKPEDIQELLHKLLKDLQIIKNSSKAIAPDLSTKEPVDSLIMEDEHLDTIPATESDEVIMSSVEELVLIPRESEGISNGVCDKPLCDNPTPLKAFKDHSEIVVNSNDDDTSSDDVNFEDIEYVEASPPDLEIVSLEEVNDVDQEKEEFDLEDILQIQDVILREKLLNINRLIANIESLNDNSTPNCVLKSPSPFPIPVSNSFFEKSDTSLSYSDNSLPKFESFSDHTEETSSGSTTTHANNSLPEYDSFHF
ncbi:hypothetical protein Tco_0304148 [Tanacetum coccineum]